MAPGPSIGVQFGRLLALIGSVIFVGSLGVGFFTYATRFGDEISRVSLTQLALPRTSATLLNVVLFSIFALHHSLFARTGIKSAVTAAVTPRFERTFYVWISSLLFIGVMLLWQPVPGTVWAIASPWRWAFVAAQWTGVLITARASGALDVFALAGLRQAFDRPAPPTTALKDSGWYGVVRHPIYLGWVLMVWPTPHMTGTRLVFAAISTFYLAIAIPFEERSLRAQFGEQYARYASRVRFRMVPFVY